jgi:phthiocerol/phenolphthiocerol synthesis type-I polyketide synthase E
MTAAHDSTTTAAGEAIAVVGMAGRFPGAPDLDAFWADLAAGIESIDRLTPEELAAAGVPPELSGRPDYVPALGRLVEPERFDAELFGVNPREAALLDPQQRLFLEIAWAAFEDAGLDSRRPPEGARAGVFAGAGMNRYLIDHVYPTVDPADWAGAYQAALANDKDFVATRVAYKLGLEGLALTVQTACSTSLVAVALACQSLATGDCDLALAGGVTLRLPLAAGYLFQEDGILSPDGHCRAFDADARGTVPGSGVGAVLLERLDDALAAGHPVRAVIRGWATNNDGAGKAGFTAPRAAGQARVVAEAMALGGVAPETVGYVEAHGTGTRLGDPIEVAALARAFGAPSGQADRPDPVLLGSVKTNLGHLDAAAGIAGLIKTVLALEHRELPPTLHYRKPNPEIPQLVDGERGEARFRVVAERTPWERRGAPRRAGVSSFGIGGTNAHVVLEEAPEHGEAAGPARGPYLFALSAAGPEALDRLVERLARHVEREPGLGAADVAHTLLAGRTPLPYRRAVVANGLTGDAEPVRALEGTAPPGDAPVAFLLSGQGSQYTGMAGDLYRRQPLFRRELDRCAEILRPVLADLVGDPLEPLLAPRRSGDDEAPDPLTDTALAQPLLVAVEHSLARLWRAWGVVPEALLGHSVGEWTAACLAGVIDLEAALPLVAERGRLVSELPTGSMIAVPLPEAELAKRIEGVGDPDLALAGVNAPGLCAAAGPDGAIDALAAALQADGVAVRRLHTSHAFHSPMLDPAVEPFHQRVAACTLRPPRIPFFSNVTGTWITDEQATDPGYWARQLRSPVRFADAAAELLAEPRRALLEVGPGDALAKLVRRQPEARSLTAARVVTASLPHATDPRPDGETILEAAGRLWVAGVAAGERYADLDLEGDLEGDLDAGGGPPRRRVRLPTYPFGGGRHWIEAAPRERPAVSGSARSAGPITKEPDPGDWFYAPVWRSAPRPVPRLESTDAAAARWLLLGGGPGAAEAVAAELGRRGEEVVTVAAGEALDTRLGRLVEEDRPPTRVLHLGGLTDPADGDDADAVALAAGLTDAVRALSHRLHGREVDLRVVTDRLFDVAGEGGRAPERATLAGIARVVPQEHPAIRCRLIDLDGPPESPEAAAELIDEAAPPALDGAPADAVALRGERRFERTHERYPLPAPAEPAPPLPADGHYLLLGGLGHFALAVAERLAARGGPGLRLTLVDRRGADELRAGSSRRLAALRASEARIDLARADLADAGAVRRIVSEAVAAGGPLAGVIHAAGAPSSAFGTLADLSADDLRAHAAPKLDGLRHLAAALESFRAAGREPLAEGAWVLAASSLAPVLGGVGLAPFAAADAALDALVERFDRERRAGARWRSVDWEGWEAPDLTGDGGPTGSFGALGSQQAALAMTPEEVGEAFVRAAGLPWRGGPSRLVAATGDLPARIEQWSDVLHHRAARAPEPDSLEGTPGEARPRPAGAPPYRALESAVEERVAAVWGELLGVDRIGADDDFFLFGGDSLVGLQVLSRLRTELDVELPLRSFFEARTVTGVAAVIEEERRRDQDEGRRMAEILAEIEALSDEDVAVALGAGDEISGPAADAPESPPAALDRLDMAPAMPSAARLAGDAPTTAYSRRAEISSPVSRTGGMAFSLFFFSADGSTASGDKYRLLLDAARLADRGGLAAVWTPERHFQDFGGLYPNPSVLGAALALATERLEIRAGSVVLPLHHPVRVAEEWAVVDNLSGGRAAISCASGWHPGDFALRAGTWEERKEVMYRDLETIRRLWRGEEVELEGGDGRPYAMRSRPRPVRRELPVWVTSSGNPETWRRAGAVGANLLTSMGGQPPAELAEKVRLYRRARAEAGHDPDAGVVTVMLHTFLGDDLARVKERVRAPMTEYLRTHMAQRDSFVEVPGITDDDRASLLDQAFEHYVREASLLGTPESVTPVVEALADAGVDEIACLADFGLEPAAVLASLERVCDFTERFRAGRPALEGSLR